MELEKIVLDRYELAKLQSDIIDLAVKFKKDFPKVKYTESTIYHNIVEYFVDNKFEPDFIKSDNTIYHHLMEKYQVKPNEI